MHVEPQLVSEPVKYLIDRPDQYGLTAVLPSIGFTHKQIVVHLHLAVGMLQIESNRFSHRVVDGDIAILLTLAGVPGLLLEHWKLVLERKIVVDQVGEPECSEIAHAESKVDTNDEHHVVPVSTLGNEIPGDAHDVIHTLDWIGCMLLS